MKAYYKDLGVFKQPPWIHYRLSVTVKLNDGIEPGIGCFSTKIYILGINEIPGNLSNYLILLFNYHIHYNGMKFAGN